jgi:predicted lactoylglutathione lyase
MGDTGQRLFSHVDLRVKDVVAATKFYDVFLAEFGFVRVKGVFSDNEPTWRREHWQANDEFIGLTVDPEFVPNANRIAFHATSPEQVDRATAALQRAGAGDIDGPTDYGGYYATFCDDPEGNKLEVCYLTHHGYVTGQ